MKNNKPNLILLNGPLAIGKSTLAKMYSARNPETLNIDIDLLRPAVEGHRVFTKESSELAWNKAAELGRAAISSGKDVCIAQIMTRKEQWQRLEELADDTGAQLFEILLYAPREEAIDRFMRRGRASGSDQGYRPGGLIDRGGGIKLLEEKYDKMIDFANSRGQTIRIDSKCDRPEETYSALLSVLNTH